MRDDRPVMPDQGVHPPSVCSQSVQKSPANAGDHLTDVLAGLASHRRCGPGGPWYLGVHSPVYQACVTPRPGKLRPGSCPVQSHILAGLYLRDFVDVPVGDDADDR